MLHLNSGKDYRFGGKKEAKTYFFPLTPENNREVNDLFSRISGGTEYHSGDVEVVQGRHIHVPKYLGYFYRTLIINRGVCEFDFAELCKQPTGASDYISLCR